MAGIDFKRVRELVPMSQVLEFLDWHPTARTGEQLRGPCPIHGTESKRSRVFSVDIRGNRFQCFKCGAEGNQLDLWVKVNKLRLFDAAQNLCERAGVDVPTIEKW
jgi:DNA primase